MKYIESLIIAIQDRVTMTFFSNKITKKDIERVFSDFFNQKGYYQINSNKLSLKIWGKSSIITEYTNGVRKCVFLYDKRDKEFCIVMFVIQKDINALPDIHSNEYLTNGYHLLGKIPEFDREITFSYNELSILGDNGVEFLLSRNLLFLKSIKFLK